MLLEPAVRGLQAYVFLGRQHSPLTKQARLGEDAGAFPVVLTVRTDDEGDEQPRILAPRRPAHRVSSGATTPVRRDEVLVQAPSRLRDGVPDLIKMR